MFRSGAKSFIVGFTLILLLHGIAGDAPHWCDILQDCTVVCEFGLDRDENGCLTCSCLDPCQNVICGFMEVCQATAVQCFRAPCPPITNCVAKPTCPPLQDCNLDCQYGLKTDKNDCSVCECLNPCQNFTCGSMEVCQVQVVQCFAAPCPPLPTCVAAPTTTVPALHTCLQSPEVGRCRAAIPRYFFNVTALACQTFIWGGCGGNGNNFYNETDCLSSCLPTTLGCPSVSNCSSPCQVQAEDNGCTTCICPDSSCETIDCQLNKVCQMVDGQCLSWTVGACLQRPQCVDTPGFAGKVTSPASSPPCAEVDCGEMSCIFGYKNDENGCMTCICVNPCEAFPCAANQKCQLTSTDCTNIKTCANPPTPYCMDVTTSTPAIDSSSDDLFQCCQAGGVKPVCQPLCFLNFTMTTSNVDMLMQCADDVNIFLKCAGNGQNYLNCCERKSVSSDCLDFCSGAVNMSTPHAYSRCLMTSDLSNVIACYQEGWAGSLTKTTPTAATTSQAEQIPSICTLSSDAGPCEGASNRWSFDPVDKTCKIFTYGGCLGNSNNFLTMKDCLTTCLPTLACPSVMCAANCRVVIGANGCNTCECDTTTLAVTTTTMSFSDCCQSHLMTEECMVLCSYNFQVTEENIPVLLSCQQYIGVALNCARGGRSYTSCCQASGVTGQCLNSCNHDAVVDECLITNLTAMSTCFQSGPTDADSVAATTLVPVISTASLTGCCASNLVSESCMRFCSYDWMISPDIISALQSCQPYLPAGLDCAKGGETFTSCCQSAGVTGECLYACGADSTIFDISCLPTNYTAMLDCFQSGRPDSTCSLQAQCSMTCPYAWQKDENGCNTCICTDPCATMLCSPGQTCTHKQDLECNGDVCGMVTIGQCASTQCGENMCMMYCQYGFIRDSNGCEVCTCFDPCMNVTCPASQQCVAVAVASSTTVQADGTLQQTYIGQCQVVCNPIKCMMFCQYGFVKDDSGCNTCGCLDPCMNVTCASGEQCVPVPLPATTLAMIGDDGANDQQTYVGQCQYLCSDIMCRMFCQFGFTTDENGCEICECSDPCMNITCPTNQQCVPTLDGTGAENYIGTCQAQCSDIMCMMFCPYNFQTDDNGCDICRCAEPCMNVSCPANQACVPVPVPTPVDGSASIKQSYLGQCQAACSDIMCTMYCPYGYSMDNNGCQLCSCFEPCKNMTCPTGQKCVETVSPSTSAMIGGDASGPQTYIGQCQLQCGPVCMIFCEYGNVKDSNGCPTCQCSDPCQNVTCPASQQCIPVASKTNPVEYIGQCQVACSPIMCTMYCQYGFVKNSNGCDVCQCFDPCMSVKCPANQKCVPQTSSTPVGSQAATYIGQCQAACSPVMCMMYCQYGNVQDSNGCPICKCKDPCQNVTCPASQQCSPVVSPTNPTEYIGQCQAACSPVMCMMYCQYGNVQDSNGCPICKCKDPCQNVTCPANQQCTPVASKTNPTEYMGQCQVGCSPIMCSMYCPYGFVKNNNGCDVCQCFDPCMNVSCPSNQKCVPVATPATDGSLTETYYGQCKIDCGPMCMMYCRYGMVQGNNGCPTCQCYDPCQNVTCDSMSICQVQPANTTATQPYSFQGVCVRCTGMLCRMACPYGTVMLSSTCSLCQCYEPCQGVNCTQPGSTCEVKPKESTDISLQSYKGVCSVACSPIMCTMYCQYGFVKNSNGCDVCQCFEPCMNVTCPVNQKCVPQNSSTAIGSQTATYVGQCQVACSLIMCSMYCQYGFVKNSNGCDVCQCFDPCMNVTCQTNQKCVPQNSSTAVGSQTATYIGRCQTACSPIMCTMYCQYGFVKNSNGCDVCQCFDPCLNVTCPANQKCVPQISSTAVGSQTATYIGQCQVVSPTCSELQQLQRTQTGVAPISQLNCDSAGNYKPLQCTDASGCRCTTSNGLTMNADQQNLNLLEAIKACFLEDRITGTMKIWGDITMIMPGDGSMFKQQISMQLANKLGMSDSNFTVTQYVSGSIVVDFVAASPNMTTMNTAAENLNTLETNPTSIKYGNGVYQTTLLTYSRGGYTWSAPTPSTPTPIASTGMSTNVLLMVILIPILVPIFILVVVIILCCVCKKGSGAGHILIPPSTRSSIQFDSVSGGDSLSKLDLKGENGTYKKSKEAMGVQTYTEA